MNYPKFETVKTLSVKYEHKSSNAEAFNVNIHLEQRKDEVASRKHEMCQAMWYCILEYWQLKYDINVQFE